MQLGQLPPPLRMHCIWWQWHCKYTSWSFGFVGARVVAVPFLTAFSYAFFLCTYSRYRSSFRFAAAMFSATGSSILLWPHAIHCRSPASSGILPPPSRNFRLSLVRLRITKTDFLPALFFVVAEFLALSRTALIGGISSTVFG